MSVVSAVPTNVPPEPSQLEQDPSYQEAIRLHRAGQLVAALTAYQNLTHDYPSAAPLFARLGSVQLQCGHLEEGVATLGHALQLDPAQAQTLSDRANGLVMLNRLEEALRDYADALALQPDYGIAWFNRGEILLSLQRLDEALASFDQAVRWAPDTEDVWVRRGECLLALNRLDEAEASFRKGRPHELGQTTDEAALIQPPSLDAALQDCEQQLARDAGNSTLWLDRGALLARLERSDDALESFSRALELAPDYAEAYFNRGVLLASLKRFDEAVATFDSVLECQPDKLEAYLNRGSALAFLERHEEALRNYDQGLAHDPDHRLLQVQRGLALLALARYEDALASFDRLIERDAEDAEAHCYRGNALKELARLDEALTALGRAIALNPGYVDGYVNRAHVLLDLQRYDEALASVDRAIFLKPDFSGAYSSRGLILQRLQRDEDALASHARAIELEPDAPGAWINRGLTRMNLGRVCEAIEDFDQAIRLKPDATDAHWNKSLSLLALGDYDEGWRLYEWRWRSKENRTHCQQWPDVPVWLGEQSLIGKTLLILAEQGLGDIIQFSRYAPWVSALGGKVVLAVPAPVVELLATLQDDILVCELGQPIHVPFDFICPIMSLPLAFGTRLPTVPARVPYLRADPRIVAEWETRLGESDRPRIGLAWSGNAQHKGDATRSLSLTLLEPLLALPCDFHVLQKDIRLDDAALLDRHANLHRHGEAIHGFANTAGLLRQLDLVITVDTSIAHLAGALAVPVWLLLSTAPDYRWMLGRIDTPWYPTATLYRQTRPGDWSGVIQGLVQRLTDVL